MVGNNLLEGGSHYMVDKGKRIIVVLGMHRSGTSAVTRGLQVMGVDLGDKLMPAIEDINAKGFWEDLDLYALNNELLSFLVSDWHHLAPIEFGDVKALKKNSYFVRAVELICQKVKNRAIFGFKDPRVAKLLPFWKEVFSCCQLDMSCVLAVRHPLSVAKSLAKRDGFDAEKNYFLWLGYVVESLSGTVGLRRVVVDYDKLMRSPEFEVNRIAKQLDLEIDLAELQNYSSEFLDKALQHTVYDLNDLSLDDACPPLVREIYATLLNLASDKIYLDDPLLKNQIAHWVNECERLKPILALADRFFMQNAIANQAVTERDERITNLNQAVTERDERITNLNQAVTERDERITNLNQALAQRDSQTATLNQTVNSLVLNDKRIQPSLKEENIKIKNLHTEQSAGYKWKSWLTTSPLRKSVRVASAIIGYASGSIKRSRTRQTIGSPAIVKILGETVPVIVSPVFRILLVSYYCPTRAHGGGLRILDIYTLIRQQCPNIQLDLLTHHRPAIDWSLDDVYRIFNNVYLSPVEDLTPDGLAALRGSPLTYNVIDLQFHESGHQIDAFRHIGSKIIFTPMESLAKVLFIDFSTKHLMNNSLRLFKIATSLRLAAEELDFTRKADEVVCVSRADAAFLRTVTSSRHVRGVDTGVSQFEFADALAPSFTTARAADRQCRVLYLAYFGSKTNVIALRWYLEHVHPLVKVGVPSYVFTVVGRGDLSPFFKYRDNSIELVGEVPTIAPYIKDARVGIAPALGGAGFRGKINQYAVLGLPCVVSPIAIKGLAYQDGVNIFIAEKPDTFADRCVRLLIDLDLNDRMGQAARKLCIDRYSWQSKWAAIRQIYKLEDIQ
jgi:glycosyltransferase involved in cell wall biosynthesis